MMKNNHDNNNNQGEAPASRRLFRRGRARTWGQTLVEFALIAPLLLMLIFGIMDLARVFQAQTTVGNAAREAIRYAITGQQEQVNGEWVPRATSIYSQGLASLIGIPLTTNIHRGDYGFYEIDINPSDGGEPDDIVEVYVYYNIQLITPFINMIVPYVTVRGFERAINEEWGAVQTFNHANLPPLPQPMPTWTPYMSPTPTSTHTNTPVPPTFTPTRTNTPLPPTFTYTRTNTPVPPTNTPLPPTFTYTRTNTPVPTVTNTPTRTTTPPTSTRTPTKTSTFTTTPTPTRTYTATQTGTPTPTPHTLIVSQVSGKKYDGYNQSIDILAKVTDDTGALINGATVTANASGGGDSWSGSLYGIGYGFYSRCSVGSFDGNYGGGVTITVTASKAGYNSGSASGSTSRGNLYGCP